MRTVEGVATELRLLAGSLESIAREIEKGEPAGATFDGWSREAHLHVSGRLQNVETLIQRIRIEIVQAKVGHPT